MGPKLSNLFHQGISWHPSNMVTLALIESPVNTCGASFVSWSKVTHINGLFLKMIQSGPGNSSR